jgi:dihydroflavonol-4-reductase
MTVLVTGAGGLVGAWVCRLAVADGHRVRALVRPGSPATELEALGCEVMRGDVGNAADMAGAAAGADAVVHTAALLGGTWDTASPDEHERVNLHGTLHVLDAAAGARTVLLGTTAFLDRGRGEPITETMPVAPENRDPYTRTKRAAYLAAMARAEAGQDVVVVMPGGVYGPAVVGRGALRPTSFNGTILRACRGELPRYPPVKLGWVLAEDVARVALLALEHGRRGARYHALGDAADAMTVPAFMSLACELAGVPHRVAPTGSPRDDPALLEEFGAMAATADTRWPEPLFDSRLTHAALGDRPVRARDGLQRTLAWLRTLGELPPASPSTPAP